MLRISNLIRRRVMLKAIPIRAGVPGWDRPDPPPSVKVPYDHELTDEEIIFYFPDRSMPEYVLTQPEVYEGDTLLQATPMLLKGVGIFFLSAFSIGFMLFLGSPLRKYKPPNASEKEQLKMYDEMKKNNTLVSLASQNPFGIKITNDSIPRYRMDIANSNQQPYKFENIRDRKNKHDQVIKEVKSYLTNVKENAQKKVQQRLAGKASGHSDSHGDHHEKDHHHHKVEENNNHNQEHQANKVHHSQKNH